MPGSLPRARAWWRSVCGPPLPGRVGPGRVGTGRGDRDGALWRRGPSAPLVASTGRLYQHHGQPGRTAGMERKGIYGASDQSHCVVATATRMERLGFSGMARATSRTNYCAFRRLRTASTSSSRDALREASPVIHGLCYEPDHGPRYKPIAPLGHRAGAPSTRIYMEGHGGPAPLEPAAGVSLTAVRPGTRLGRPEPTHRWTEQRGRPPGPARARSRLLETRQDQGD
jgi:hypothetical protein